MTRTTGKTEAMIARNAAEGADTTIEVFGERYRVRPDGGGRLVLEHAGRGPVPAEFGRFGEAADACEALKMIREHRDNV